MMSMTPKDVSKAKDAMWRHGMTRREAICWVLHQRGIPAKTIAEEVGTSETLIYRRIASARKKLRRELEDSL